MEIQKMLDSGYKIYNRFSKEEWKEGTVNELEEDYPFLKGYVKKINWYGKNTRVAILKSLSEEKRYHIYMFSNKNLYSITINPSYMGAEYSCLYERPMEDWTRGNDLPDGACNKETFKSILFAILACELVDYGDGTQNFANSTKTCKDEHKEKQYIIITQKILDYIGKHEWSFENSTPKLGDFWKVIEICKYPSVNSGKPVVEVVNEGSGDWMRLPLNIVDIKIEHNFTDKVEPKLNIESGKWYICIRELLDDYGNIAFCKGDVYLSEKDGYLIPCNSNVPCKITYCVDTYFRNWDISDAKDGDVLYATGLHNECIFIFNGIDYWKFNEPNGDRAVATGYCYLSVSADKMEFDMQGPDCVEVYTVKPASNIQRDILFQKMREAGYKWDAELKQLRKIEQNSTWTEEDNIEQGILSNCCDFSKPKRWINSLSKGFNIQQNPAWSEEDDYIIEILFCLLDNEQDNYPRLSSYFKDIEKTKKWLKSIKERVQPQNLTVTDEELAQAKKDAYNDALDKIEYHSGEPSFDDGWSAAIWYLKKRNTQPQSTWKASDEQMNTLEQ